MSLKQEQLLRIVDPTSIEARDEHLQRHCEMAMRGYSRWASSATAAAIFGCIVATSHLGAIAEVNAASNPPAVIWYAPFLSGGGYCSEAHSYVEAIELATRERDAIHSSEKPEDDEDAHLHSALSGSHASDSLEQAAQKRAFDLLITQHGDSFNAAFIRDLTHEMRDLLESHWVEERDFHWRLKNTKIALAICHSEPGAWHPAHYKTSRCPPDSAAYKVGRTMFETDRVPDGWTERMNAMDEIWVPTQFQKRVFIEGGVREESVHVLPEAVDVHFFDPESVDVPYDLAKDIPQLQVTPKTTVFLSIFKWEERKAWRVLLKAYFQAFAKTDDVVLTILTSAYHIASEKAEEFSSIIADFARAELNKELSELPCVHVLPPNLPQERLPSLYKAATAFVLPSRGEGWGRPHVEAMAMALPLISTFWSGTTEYMTEDNSYPLRIDGLIEITDGAFRGHKWAEPSVEHLVELLQHVKSFPADAREKGTRARQDMVSKYSPEVIGRLLLAHIDRILAVVAKRRLDEGGNLETHDEL